MVVYNITIKVDPQIEKEWVEWQKKEHIPAVMATGFFNDHRFFKLLEQDETEGATYVIQYFTSSIDKYKRYMEQFAVTLSAKAFTKWSDRSISFQTVMQIVN